MTFDKYIFKAGNSLADFDTYENPQSMLELDEKGLKNVRLDLWKQVSNYQERLYAESKQSLLIVLQAMDAAGKDSSIAKLTSRMNVQGCHVHSFKSPTKKELAHDFLWRVHNKVPANGEVTIFNRSHYEDVLIVKVHGWADDGQIEARYDHIKNFESLLADRGTKVIKFMLNISPEYQMQRFVRRLDRPEKNWKFNPGDLAERKLWPDYMAAFETAMSRTSTDDSPWYVVPAEDRLFRDIMIASLVLDQLKQLNPQYPEPEFDTDIYNSESIKDSS